MIGAADLAIDDLAHREVGVEMRAPGALHNRLSGGITAHGDAAGEEVHTNHRATPELTGRGHGKPRWMEATTIDGRAVHCLHRNHCCYRL